VNVHPLLHGRLHVLVLGHRLRMLLGRCFGWFFKLLLPCSCSLISCCMGGCTCSCSGTGCRCFSAIVWGGFPSCCSRARARASAVSWAIARVCAQAPAAGVSLPLFGVVFAAVAAVLVQVHPLLHERLRVLVLGHLLRVSLCLCWGWFLRLLLPCLCSCIRCFMGKCTSSFSGATHAARWQRFRVPVRRSRFAAWYQRMRVIRCLC